MFENSSRIEKVRKILEKFPSRREYILKAFHEVQASEKHHYISNDVLEMFAQHFKLTKGELYGIISYYSMLSAKPRAPIVVKVCTTTPCHFLGGSKIFEELKQLNDVELHIEETACLGHCEKAPVIAVNGEIISVKEFQHMNDLINHIKKVAHESDKSHK